MAATKRTRYEVFCDRMTTAERLSSEIRDDEFVSNGSQWKITANGGSALVWDIIFFISKLQNNH